MEHGISASTWVVLALVVVVAKVGGELALRLKQPAVLGELLTGVVLGNLPLPWLDLHDPALAFSAELGVVLLLFRAGLESSVGEMVAVAPRAGVVATIGVVVPSALGIGASRALYPEAPFAAHLFIGATLCATSVGITASVLGDLGVARSKEARIIVGAAVIDDILGLIVLAIVSGVAVSGAVNGLLIARVSVVAIVFVVGALALGIWVTRGLFMAAAKLRSPYVLGALSIAFALAMAGASAATGLAAIVGAYAAGLLLDDVSVRPFGEKGIHGVEDFVAPIVAVFAPLFFVRTGMSVKLAGLGSSALVLTALLIGAAVVGKLASGLGVRERGVDRLMIGLGMTPRGEVGLIFASAGGGLGVLPPGVHAALVATVLATTVMAPPALAARIRMMKKKSETEEAGVA